MGEIDLSKGINILFKNSSGGVDRVTVASDREAQQVIEQRAALGETAIASVPEHEAVNLTERYRILTLNDPLELRR